MKKILITILIMCLLTTATACGAKDDTGKDKNIKSTENNVQSTTGISSDKTDEVKDNKGIELIYTFKDPGNPVAFDYPNLKSIEEATSQVFKNSKYIIVYCTDTGDCELKDIPTSLSENFYHATDIHLTAPFDSFSIEKTNSLKVGEQELLQINGHVVVKRSAGTLVNLPMQGYTFKKDGVLYELIGVLNEESNPENQAEMEATVEAMISTLRDDR